MFYSIALVGGEHHDRTLRAMSAGTDRENAEVAAFALATLVAPATEPLANMVRLYERDTEGRSTVVTEWEVKHD